MIVPIIVPFILWGLGNGPPPKPWELLLSVSVVSTIIALAVAAAPMFGYNNIYDPNFCEGVNNSEGYERCKSMLQLVWLFPVAIGVGYVGAAFGYYLDKAEQRWKKEEKQRAAKSRLETGWDDNT